MLDGFEDEDKLLRNSTNPVLVNDPTVFFQTAWQCSFTYTPLEKTVKLKVPKRFLYRPNILITKVSQMEDAKLKVSLKQPSISMITTVESQLILRRWIAGSSHDGGEPAYSAHWNLLAGHVRFFPGLNLFLRHLPKGIVMFKRLSFATQCAVLICLERCFPTKKLRLVIKYLFNSWPELNLLWINLSNFFQTQREDFFRKKFCKNELIIEKMFLKK